MYAKLKLLGLIGLILLAMECVGFADDFKCSPTPADMMGPYYTPGAPVRNSVGVGYVLSGVVKSAKDCSPLAAAKIEFWLTGPDGNYDNHHRATVISDSAGEYRFESNFPPAYGFRPPHIHIKVSANGYEILVSQHYPDKGTAEGTFDLVLKPL